MKYLAVIILCALASCKACGQTNFAGNRLSADTLKAKTSALYCPEIADSSARRSSNSISDKFLDAVAMVESSGRTNAVGDGGKALGMFQLHRAAWEDAAKIEPSLGAYKTGALNPATARRAARVYFQILSARLIRANVAPSPAMLYAAYNCGFTGFSKRGFDLSNCPASTQKAVKKLEALL